MVSIGDIVKVKVIGIDKERQKVNLSMKNAQYMQDKPKEGVIMMNAKE